MSSDICRIHLSFVFTVSTSTELLTKLFEPSTIFDSVTKLSVLEHQRNQRYFQTATTHKHTKSKQRTNNHVISTDRRRAVPPQRSSAHGKSSLVNRPYHQRRYHRPKDDTYEDRRPLSFDRRGDDSLCIASTINISLAAATNDAIIILPSIGTLYHRPNDDTSTLRPLSFIVVSAAVRSSVAAAAAAAMMIVCASHRRRSGGSTKIEDCWGRDRSTMVR